MRKTCFIILASLLISTVFAADNVRVNYSEATVTQADTIVAAYRAIPKGVVLEGTAEGIDELSIVTYDKEKNEFTINGKYKYKNPVDRKEWVQIFKALKKDDRMGVTLLAGQPRVYGPLNENSSMIESMIEADKLIGGLIYGLDHLLVNIKLPDEYKPKKAADRKIPVVAFANFNRFVFEKVGESYQRVGCSLDVHLIPLAEKKTDNGGHLPDKEKLQAFIMEESDRENLEHLRGHQADYFKIPSLGRTVAVGEAASFARLVRDSNFDHEILLNQMK